MLEIFIKFFVTDFRKVYQFDCMYSCFQGWLNSIIFIGMMVGAYAWGSVADSLGRKRVLIAISIVNGIAIVASSFSQNFELFMLFRFINGAA